MRAKQLTSHWIPPTSNHSLSPGGLRRSLNPQRTTSTHRPHHSKDLIHGRVTPIDSKEIAHGSQKVRRKTDHKEKIDFTTCREEIGWPESEVFQGVRQERRLKIFCPVHPAH